MEVSILRLRSARGNEYIYDVCSNSIFPVSSLFIDLLDLYLSFPKKKIIDRLSKRYSSPEVEALYKYVDVLVKKYNCFFFEKRNKCDAILAKELFEKKIANVKNLVLEVTQNCNFRCKYCSYSGSYYYNRLHNQLAMSFDIATKSIDYFGCLLHSALRTAPRKNAIISFYGGEPLLEFKLIKKCVDYCKSNSYFDHQNIRFSVTTNGSLLSDRIIDYLARNDFILDISLDGPKEVHDTNRVFRNGKGSFDKIWENVIRIHEKYRAYYNDRVKFLITLSPNQDLEEMVKFFDNPAFFNDKNIEINSVNEADTTFFKESKNHPKFFENLKKYYEEYKSSLIRNCNEKVPTFVRVMFNPIFSQFEQLSYEPVDRISKFTGTCYPGSKKIFVSADGNYHICERVNHNFPIGNYLNGVEIEKVTKIWSDYFRQIGRNCKKCKILHFCPVCFASSGKGGFFEARPLCKKYKKITIKNMIDYVSIKEENPRAFEK